MLVSANLSILKEEEEALLNGTPSEPAAQRRKPFFSRYQRVVFALKDLLLLMLAIPTLITLSHQATDVTRSHLSIQNVRE